jgi:hypothetical protein
MLPWVYEFHWSIGHIIFLSLFFGVVTLIAITCVRAGLSASRALNRGRSGSIRWHGEFSELPLAARACRHELSGQVQHRSCANGFDCGRCSFHRDMTREELPSPSVGEKLHHRGHTWVSPNGDSTVTVGLDDIANRLVGKGSGLELPAPGTILEALAPLGRFLREAGTVRILSPVSGEVIEQLTGEAGVTLRIRLTGDESQLAGLLRGEEAEAWMMRERERLELSLSNETGIAALADGGEIVENLGDQLSAKERSRVLGEFFLDY